MNKKNEEKLSQNLANWLSMIRHNGKEVMYHFDFGSGSKMTIGQATKQKSLNKRRGFPDLFIMQPIKNYSGLFLELKKNHDELYCKDGSFRKTEHINEQRDYIRALELRGYRAVFACGFDEAVNIIRDYLDGKP